MSQFVDLAGKIKVEVRYSDGHISDLRLSSSRPQGLTRLLTGLEPEEVLARLPLMFNLCGAAQTVAGVSALEAALKITVSETVKQARAGLVLAETARELCIRLGRDWLAGNEILDLRNMLDWFSEQKQMLHWALQLNPEIPQNKIPWHRSAGDLKAIINPLFKPNDLQFKEAIYAHSKTHPVGAAVAELSHKYADVHLFEGCPDMQMTWADLLNRLDRDGERFCAFPETEKGCRETSLWTRNLSLSMLHEAELLSMHPLAKRLLAILLELKHIPQRLLRLSEETLIASHESGLARVEAARGHLIHKVSICSQAHRRVVDEYMIVAPTEWNFHPKGTLVKMLQGVRVEQRKVKSLVETLILAIDPCVAHEVEVNSDA